MGRKLGGFLRIIQTGLKMIGGRLSKTAKIASSCMVREVAAMNCGVGLDRWEPMLLVQSTNSKIRWTEMAKPKESPTAIVKGTKNTSLVSEDKSKADLILNYLARFADIEGRGREITDSTRAAYLEAIINHKPSFALGQIEKGLRTAMETQKGWPWPADLIEYIDDEI